MKDILAASNAAVLKRFARSRVLLGFDFDGTLAPITPHPARAAMRPRTRALLEKLAHAYPCVVISGRARRDVLLRLAGVTPAEVIGNHGGEPRQAPRRVAGKVRRWSALLQRRLAGLPGVFVEDKVYSIALHYRGARDKRAARAALLAASAGLSGARLVPGKLVLNLVPLEAPHKGVALADARDRLRCETALYVGDDGTDEDVFAMGPEDRLLAIRVGWKRGSRARYFIRGQAQADTLLRRLLQLADPRHARR
jgi:trehalose 6-phosphate phosphatase